MKKIIIAGILILAVRTIYKIGKEEMYYNPYGRRR